jgi:serine protease Do
MAVDDSDVKALKLKDNIGVKVTSVTPGTAAATAGLRKDDVILEIDGQKATDAGDFQDSIIGKTPGAKINLTIWRMGAKQNIVATLGTRPFGLPLQEVPAGAMPLGSMSLQDLAGMASAMGSVVAPRLGFDFVEVMPQLADFFGVMGGVLVENVSARSAAGKAGLKAGDIVTKVNGTPVADPRDVVAIIRQSGKKQVSLTVMRNRKEITLSMELSMSFDPFFHQLVN